MPTATTGRFNGTTEETAVEFPSPKRPEARRAGRLMLSNVGRLGDTILRNSILDSAFRTYDRVDYLCGRSNADLVQCDRRLNQVTIFQNSLSGFARLLKAAASYRYDAFIDLKNHLSRISLLIARLFRCRAKTGWNSDYLRSFHRDVRSVFERTQHQTETMRLIGRLAGLEEGEYRPSLILVQDSIDWFEKTRKSGKPFIFLNLSATATDRMWPVEKWASYLSGCGLGKATILVNGTLKDRPMAEQLCGKLPGAEVFRPRHFNDVAAAVNKAQLVLTVDTAVVHACSAFNRPIIALYCALPVGVENEPLSSRRLVIRSQGGVPDLDPQQAIAETLRHGLP